MEMTPLALVVLLGFGLLIAICLTAWTAVSYDSTGGDEASTEPRTRGAAKVDGERSNSGQGVRRQRRDGARRTDTVRASGGSRTITARTTRFEGAEDGSSGKSSRPELSGGAWRSAGGATVTARRVAPEQARESDAKAPKSGGRGGKPKQTRGANADASESKQEHDEDAFERFLRARPDDIDLG